MKHNIDDLLNKYWEGESSVEEENTLKQYFNSEKIADDHLAYKDLFTFFVHQANITFPEPTQKSNTLNIRYLSIKKYVYAVAAIFLLAVSSVFVMKNLNETKPITTASNVQEIEDPEEALRVTLEALALVSTKFNKTQEVVKENMAQLERASIFK